MSYIDLGIIIVVGLCALIGLWKGFFKTVISFCGWFAAFLIAFFIAKPVAQALLDIGSVRSFVVGTCKGWSMYSWIYEKLPDITTDLNAFWRTVLTPFIDVAAGAYEGSGYTLKQSVALLIANGMFTVVVFFGLLFVLRILLLLFTMFANAMTRGKFVGALNRLLGFAAGAVRGVCFVIIIMVLMNFLMGLSFMGPVRTQLDNSVIGLPVYNQVSKLTDKFITGGESALRKMMNLAGQEEYEPEPEPEPDERLGVYTHPEADGNYELELKADGTCVLTVTQPGVGGRTEREGTYQFAENGVTLIIKNPDETEETVTGTYNSEGWIYFETMGGYFAKEGVTPPEEIDYGNAVGVYTYSDESGNYTLTLAGDGTFSLYNSTDESNLTGNFDADEGTLNIIYSNGETATATYDKEHVYWGGRTFNKQ